MNRTRIPVLIVSISLFAVAILAVQTFLKGNSASNQPSLSVGIGDLRRYESQQVLPNTGGKPSSALPGVGMGDLRRFENSKAASQAASQESRSRAVGIGDLRRFEFQQSQP